MSAGNVCRGLLYAVLLTAFVAAGDNGPPKKASTERIAKLISQLASDDSKIRDEASRQLAELDEALHSLRLAAKSDDAEVRRRAETLVAKIETRLADQFIKEAIGRVNEEGLDLFVDRMVRQKGYATDARWKASAQLAKALSKRASQAGATPPGVVDQDFLLLPETTTWDAKAFRQARIRIDGIDEILAGLHGCFLLSSGSLPRTNSINNSILFVNGDIESLNSTTNSVIICTGTIKSLNSTRNCLVFCKGTIESMNASENNAIFVRGALKRLNFTKNNVIEATQLGRGTVSEGNTYLNRQALEATVSKQDTFRPLEPSVLELFRFFDVRHAGLDFKMADGDVLVEATTPGKAFAKAGLQKGDRVVAVNQQRFLTEDAFLRLLRRQVAVDSAQLKVERGDRIVQITVSFAP
jgi:hypothetical protein